MDKICEYPPLIVPLLFLLLLLLLLTRRREFCLSDAINLLWSSDFPRFCRCGPLLPSLLLFLLLLYPISFSSFSNSSLSLLPSIPCPSSLYAVTSDPASRQRPRPDLQNYPVFAPKATCRHITRVPTAILTITNTSPTTKP
ncbi:hypothetical protein E2C01_068579 [Portunus trituberculatus]|uniref:Uncharacterized protein n=1 Tax=Portunus trituberculatus TaxID=210409 RepID=A0A5B7HWV6_PORTR|nr:hypothetical protein [Portunus trituberculatus]